MDIKLLLNPIQPLLFFPARIKQPRTMDPQKNLIISTEEPTVRDDGAINEACTAVTVCRSDCFDNRKVVSHIFGRNKACTTQINDACIIVYCRKHYQRFRFRCQKYKRWLSLQADCVRLQLERMEEWGGVTSWSVALRLAEQKQLDAENAAIARGAQALAADTNSQACSFTAVNDSGTKRPCRERFLVPYLGDGKTFADIYKIVDLIQDVGTANEWLEFPGVEFLPVIDPDLYPTSGMLKKQTTVTAKLPAARVVDTLASPKLRNRTSLASSAYSTTSTPANSTRTRIAANPKRELMAFPRQNPAVALVSRSVLLAPKRLAQGKKRKVEAEEEKEKEVAFKEEEPAREQIFNRSTRERKRIAGCDIPIPSIEFDIPAPVATRPSKRLRLTRGICATN